MENEFLVSTLFNFAINLLYTFVALFIAVLSLKVIDKVLLHKLDIEDELKQNNLSVAIFASAILIFVAIIVSIGLRS